MAEPAISSTSCTGFLIPKFRVLLPDPIGSRALRGVRVVRVFGARRVRRLAGVEEDQALVRPHHLAGVMRERALLVRHVLASRRSGVAAVGARRNNS